MSTQEVSIQDVVAEVADWERLAIQDEPVLIGVRHHSPSVARVMTELLDAARPDVVMIELPAEATEWLAWLTHPDTVEPVSLGVADQGGSEATGSGTGMLASYPFAAFSPELVTLRWAAQRGVRVVCGDLPAAARHGGRLVSRLDDEDEDRGTDESGAKDLGAEQAETDAPGPITPVMPGLMAELSTVVQGEHPQDVWDRLVEVRAVGATAESIRRAALATGWAMRCSDSHLDELTAAREATMRTAVRTELAEGRRVLAVIGSYHAAALTPDVLGATVADDAALLAQWPVPEQHTVRGALMAGRDEFLDPRSGYPAGIRDPQWQRAMLAAGEDRAAMHAQVTSLLTRIAAEIRVEGHPCGPGEAAEASRMAADLAALRGLPAPGRRELLESMTSTYAHGEVLGRGRVVARAAQRVLVGSAVGKLPAAVPRSGVAADFDAHRERLKLPDRGELALEPLRNELDAEREVFLQRCLAAGILYGEPQETSGVGGAVAVRSLWRVALTPSTEPSLAGAGALGITVAQAAASRLIRPLRRGEAPSTQSINAHLERTAETGLVDAHRMWAAEGQRRIPTSGSLTELIDTREVCQMVTSGLIVGATGDAFVGARHAVDTLAADCTEAAIRQVPGLAGSVDPDDAAALGRVMRSFGWGSLRLRHQLETLTREGSALIRGAAAAALWDAERAPMEPHHPALRFAELLRSASHPEARKDLADWVRGFLAAAPELLGSDEQITDHVTVAVEELPDAVFVARLPALRAGFDPMSPMARERLLTRVGENHQRELDTAPEDLIRWAQADQEAFERLRQLGLADMSFAPAARWRLMLGRGRGSLGASSRRLARSLDQLYGGGAGEGQLGDRARTTGMGGQEPPLPNARVWREELDELFGTPVREEVVAEAAGQGNPWAIEALDVDSVRPSVDLLSTILSLRGALPEATMARLRPVVRRIVDDLAKALATKLRPALRGLGGHRRTMRNTKRLDPSATIRRNLSRTVRSEDGQLRLIASEPVFRQPVAKHADWEVIVLVDVSGSMEPSTVFAALTAAVMAGVPALSVTFLTFSTEVVDLTGRVDDPLALLLEIQVGGGTHIGKGLQVARSMVRNPTRTLLVLISDFYEGYGPEVMLSEVRTMAQAGVRMLGCAALDDTGVANYHVATAQNVAAAGMPVAAVSPSELVGWVAEQINR